MNYNKLPEMILFDVGGTLFDDTRCIAFDGLSQLRLYAENPDVTNNETLAKLWDEYMDEIGSGTKSKSGHTIDFPLSATIKYVTMKAGLHFKISLSQQEEVFDRFNSQRKVISGVVDLLKTLDDLKIRSAVISNNAMSGESLHMAIKKWIPLEKFEFCLTSADLHLAKPCKEIFVCAANYAGVPCENCWYCGDSKVADVEGAFNSGMTPVLLDQSMSEPFEMRTNGNGKRYFVVSNWSVLESRIRELI